MALKTTGRYDSNGRRLCEEPGCDRVYKSNGRCSKCVQTWRNRQRGVKPRRHGPSTCTIDGCKGRLARKGLCGMHAQRLELYGTVEPANVATPSFESCSARIARDQTCRRDHYAKGYCRTHYARLKTRGAGGCTASKPTKLRPTLHSRRTSVPYPNWAAPTGRRAADLRDDRQCGRPRQLAHRRPRVTAHWRPRDDAVIARATAVAVRARTLTAVPEHLGADSLVALAGRQESQIRDLGRPDPGPRQRRSFLGRSGATDGTVVSEELVVSAIAG